jgi:hypothetical protein
MTRVSVVMQLVVCARAFDWHSNQCQPDVTPAMSGGSWTAVTLFSGCPAAMSLVAGFCTDRNVLPGWLC